MRNPGEEVRIILEKSETDLLNGASTTVGLCGRGIASQDLATAPPLSGGPFPEARDEYGAEQEQGTAQADDAADSKRDR